MRDLKGVMSHRNEISRHRQEQELPKTPPGYWDIGFPDTQEAELINKQANKLLEGNLRTNAIKSK